MLASSSVAAQVSLDADMGVGYLFFPPGLATNVFTGFDAVSSSGGACACAWILETANTSKIA